LCQGQLDFNPQPWGDEASVLPPLAIVRIKFIGLDCFTQKRFLYFQS